MKRLSTLVLLSALLFCTGCGDVFIRGAINTGSSIRGSVLSVQLGSALNGMGEVVQITIVTFLQTNTSFTANFCNDQMTLFPLNQTVTVNFNPGQPCGTIISVVVIG